MARQCGECKLSKNEPRVQCNGCGRKFHISCAKVNIADKDKPYFCKPCHEKEEDKCFKCKIDLDRNSMMAQCDTCIKWYHYSCEDLDDSVKYKNFICSLCCSKGLNKCGKCEIELTMDDVMTQCGGCSGHFHQQCVTTDGVEIDPNFVCEACIDKSRSRTGNLNKTPPKQPSKVSEVSEPGNQEDPKQVVTETNKEVNLIHLGDQNEDYERMKELLEAVLRREQSLKDALAEKELQEQDNEAFMNQVVSDLEAKRSECESLTAELRDSRELVAAHEFKIQELSKQVSTPVDEAAKAREFLNQLSARERYARMKEGATSSRVEAPKVSNKTIETKSNEHEDDVKSVTSSSHGEKSSMPAYEKYMFRQLLPELPKFTGEDLMKWPEFETAFDQSTIDGDYTEYENCIRLRKVVLPPARDLVHAELTRATSATDVMKILKASYGRSEVLLAKMLEDLLDVPKLSSNNDVNLKKLSLKLSSYVNSIMRMKMFSGLSDPSVESLLLKKIEKATTIYKIWMEKKDSKSDLTLKDFADFLNDQWTRMPAWFRDQKTEVSKSTKFEKPKESKPRHVLATAVAESSSTVKCSGCGSENHRIYKCENFTKMTIADRDKFVREKRLCFGCLNTGHGSRDCPYKRTCGIDGCEAKHNRFLHVRRNAQAQQGNEAAGAVMNHVNLDVHNVNVHSNGNVLAKVIGVRIYGRGGKYADTYAFLDDGSHVTMVEKDLLKSLNIAGEPEELKLQWTQEIVRKEIALRCSLNISALDQSNRFILDNVYAVEEMSLPSQTQNAEELCQNYRHLRGLKIPSFEDARPRMLIGLNQTRFLTSEKTVEGKIDEPAAAKTKLGWVVYGASRFGGSKSNLSAHHIPVLTVMKNKSVIQQNLHDATKNDAALHELVKRHFTTESFGVSASAKDVKSREDERAEMLMNSTLKFVDGRYEIGLLWKEDDMKLPESYTMALQRLKRNEDTLKRKPELMKWMNDHVKSLIDKGYARVATEKDLNTEWKRVFYCPMFVTFNNNKIPPKPRCVWDVAAKSHYPDGVSLNSCLLSGPDNLAPLLAGLSKFREHKIAVNGDVKEMFLQVKIREEDQQCQRFLWRDCDQSKEPTILIMDSMCFGPTDSPAKAQFVKNFHAEKYRERFPEACEALKNSTYVDDYFNSHPTVEKAIQVSNDAIQICADMKFDLVGFQSNSLEVLKALPQKNVKEVLVDLDGWHDEPYISKVLGICWDATNDVFLYKRKNDELMTKMMTDDYQPTKRETLRVLMRTFDPLGLLSKYLIRGKMILQDIWRSGVGWDEAVSKEISESWRKFIQTFDLIEKIRIPRHYAPVNPQDCRVELVTFVDASDQAFAAVCYFRFVAGDNVNVALVMAKAKVAPVKPLTIPRLELQAALLGVRLATSVKNLHSFEIAEQIFLSDSSCVLSWIGSPKSKQDKFIGSRIGEIFEKSSSNEWSHVRSKLNVADEATKITKEVEDVEVARWFKGPEFLLLPREEWPINRVQPAKFVSFHGITNKGLNPVESISAHYQSNWKSVCHVVGFLLRLKKPKIERPRFKYIQAVEMEAAELVIFRKIQADAFPEEVNSLQEWNSLSEDKKMMMNRVPLSSPLSQREPFMDDYGIIRLKSRNQSLNTSYAARNPVVLPNRHELVDTFVRYHHEKNHHVLTETTIANIRETVWILGTRKALHRVVSKCVSCKFRKAKPEMPKLAFLHESRTAFHLPAFSHVGVDCFGPIYVKQGRATVKRWVVLFTCLTFRGIHMEIVKDCSSDKMLGAIRRLIARRGKVLRLYSDNATNFTGANNQSKRDYDDVQEAYGKAAADEMKIDWTFISAYSPWMGGAWERLIQIVKRVLGEVINDDSLEETVLSNALIEAELIVNNRPLTHTPINPEDEAPLTPNSAMFPAKQPPRYVVASQEADHFSKHDHYKAQAIAERFAARWTREYLPEISQQSQKTLKRKFMKVDDIVLVTEPNLPRKEWKLGRVIRIHPSKDGVPRQIDVKLASGGIELKRSVGRCALLDIRGDEEPGDEESSS